MALSKINRNSLNTGISDSSDATAVTITSAENVGIGTGSPNDYYAKDLVVNSADEGGITILNSSTHAGGLFFADGTSANAYRSYIQYDHNTDEMVIATSATHAMKINADGEVTKPNQPSISVQGDGTGSHQITGDHVVTEFTTSGTNFYNQGITFNNSDGKFTVPTTGRYQINVCIYMYSDNVYVRLHTKVNGTTVLHWSRQDTTGAGDMGQDTTLQGSCILTLAADDYIQFEIAHGGTNKNHGMWAAHSHASMHLLS